VVTSEARASRCLRLDYFIFCHTTVTTLILPLAENGAG
jgi:hypothetical protein